VVAGCWSEIVAEKCSIRFEKSVEIDSESVFTLKMLRRKKDSRWQMLRRKKDSRWQMLICKKIHVDFAGLSSRIPNGKLEEGLPKVVRVNWSNWHVRQEVINGLSGGNTAVWEGLIG